MRPSIAVEKIGKRFRTWGSVPTHSTLRDALVSATTGVFRIGRAGRHAADQHFWALRDISFTVLPGEAVGIIGPNGAGKSTLLKILAQITEPTEGRGEVYGRVGSLLEVGTGFHSELTGRENIYLSGAILGMKRAEIVRKFDEVVQFAEVEQFVDTPVKHYSSGMYLRLAFAVAAHLDPHILIVDEVLAVGDERFQRKCIGKMEEVSRSTGRTILFVSHNLAAVQSLCSRCLLLRGGKLEGDGAAREIVAGYLGSLDGSMSNAGQWIDLTQLPRRGSGNARVVAIEYASDEPAIGFQPYSEGPLNLRLRIAANRLVQLSGLAVTIQDVAGTILVNADSVELGWKRELAPGDSIVDVRIRSVHLKPGPYTIGVWLEEEGGPPLDYLRRAFGVQILAGPGGEAKPRHVAGGEGAVTCDFEISSGPGIDRMHDRRA